MKSLNCDIIALQELNEYTPEKLAKEAKSWGHSYSALLKENGFPTGMTSKFPLRNLKKEMAGYHHGMLSCEAGGIQIYVIHLHPGQMKKIEGAQRQRQGSNQAAAADRRAQRQQDDENPLKN